MEMRKGFGLRHQAPTTRRYAVRDARGGYYGESSGSYVIQEFNGYDQ